MTEKEFDKRMKERAQREPTPLPQDFAGRVRQTCASLEDRPMKAYANQPKHRARRWIASAGAIAALFVALPNVSAPVAHAMEKLPLVGPLVQVVTFRDYTYDDGKHQASVQMPQTEEGGQSGQKVNEDIKAYTDRLIQQFEEEAASNEGYQGLDMTYEVLVDNEDWFTLRIDTLHTQASAAQTTKIYNIDKQTDQVIPLSGLFPQGTDYASPLRQEVLRQMQEQMDTDPSVSYFPEEFQGVTEDQNYYWNTEGQLVLVFDEYMVAPGSMGSPEFIIPAAVTQPLLG